MPKFQELLSYECWDDVFVTDDANTPFNAFLNTYLKIFQSYFIKKKVTPKPNHYSWVTSGIKTSCKRKRELYLKLRQDNDPNLKLYYKKYCKVLATIIKEAKKLYYDNAILKSKNKIKTTWSIVKKETGNKNHKNDVQLLKISNTIIKDKVQITNIFDEYFSSVAQIGDINKDNNESTNNTNPLNYLHNSFNFSFGNIKWHCTSTAEIRKIIKSLKTKSSCGYDEISAKVLKVSMPYIISPLTYICNTSLAQGIFPDRLKLAVVKPIFKNGDRCDPSNYRPISLLSSFSKVFERLVYNRLYEHVSINNILDINQYGFWPNSSTEKLSFELIDEILKSMNNKHLVGGIFCDFKKAFDCVSHDILIKKLEFYGIAGKFNALIKSYFKGRYQKVILSRWMEIKFGLPQGSILGPLFFLLYINDITNVCINGAKIFLYADDTSIIVTNPDHNGCKLAMNKIFHEVNNWFKTNMLSLN
jgi:hypothetical protein